MGALQHERTTLAVYLRAKNQSGLWNKIVNALTEGNKIWGEGAPVLIVSFAKKSFSKNDQRNAFAKYDLGAANGLLALQATAMGLQVHQMGGYHDRTLRENLAITEAYELGAVMAVGYPGDPDTLPQHLAQREQAPRQRKKQEVFVFNEILTG